LVQRGALCFQPRQFAFLGGQCRFGFAQRTVQRGDFVIRCAQCCNHAAAFIVQCAPLCAQGADLAA